ncbi:MAG TPA: VTT domain-containing protein [Candidatus Limnocylindrales bacterium]|jgi:membrane protein DedA with SNARE-associated domain|nr:VTT domain-containing protein [Candidatus Limnocylindrales bacterium]
MAETLQFVVQHGYLLLFFWVLMEQAGLPIPAMPLLLAAGALAGQHQLNFALVVLVAATGSLFSDTFWYFFGKRKGPIVLNFLCKIALEPDSCVRRTESTFTRFGLQTLLICKFVPGLNTAAPALSATAGIGLPQFLLYDFMGALLWSSAFAGLGLLFSRQLDRVAHDVAQFGSWTLLLVIAGIGGYVAYKFYERHRFLKQVAGFRITPEELKEKLEAGEPMTIIDLRHPLDLLPDPQTLPGALRISPEELESRQSEITRGGEIVLFCT